MLEDDVSGGQQTYDLEQKASRYHDRSLAVGGGVSIGAEGHLHVCCSYLEPCSVETQENPAQDLNGPPRRDRTSDQPENTGKLVAGTGDLHSRGDGRLYGHV